VDPSVLLSAISVTVALAIALHVGLRAPKTELHWTALALLATIAVSSAALGLQHLAQPHDSAVLLCTALASAMPRPALWAFLAVRHARFAWFGPRSGALLLWAPAALFVLCLLSNPLHRGVLRAVVPSASSPVVWAGPIFWAYAVWATACGVGTALVYLGTALRLWKQGERRSLHAVAGAGLLPLIGGGIFLWGGVPSHVPLAAASTLAALLLLMGTVLRYPLLENVPLAHRDVLERLQDGFVIANRSGLILDINSAATRLLALPEGGIPSRSLSSVFAAVLRAREADVMGQRFQELLDSSSTLQFEMRTRDDRVIDVRADCVRSENGESIGEFAVLRDRTDERRYGEIVRRTQKLETVGTMAAGIAHEINNPLAFIRANLGHLQRLGEQIDRIRSETESALANDLGELREIAQEAIQGIDRIQRIVDDMRQLSSAPREGFAPIDLNEVVNEATRLARLRRGTPVEICVSLDASAPSVLGVTQLLVQGVLNLLVNALQALEGHTDARICVETRQQGGEVLIRIEDNGPGIPADLQRQIFDPFFTTKAPGEGTGLGLSIVRDIFDDHGGSVEVRSESGRGATFIARVPARPTPGSPLP